MDWVPLVNIDSKDVFQRTEVWRQVPTRHGVVQQREIVDSLHTARRIEKDSEQRYKDGEGEPLRFRVYNQDASNRDQNAFGAEGRIGTRTYDSGRTPSKSEKLGVTRHGEQKPKAPLGPGLRRATTPLKG